MGSTSLNEIWKLPLDDARTALQELAARPLRELITHASRLRDEGHGGVVSYSRKVFIPLTRLCRDVCHYCTFASTPSRLPSPYMDSDQVLAIARAGRAASCKEALFTLGDKPELRWQVARDALHSFGCSTTVEYLERVCQLVFEETGLLPHVNAGVLSREELLSLRAVSASQGLMLEGTAPSLNAPGGPHYGSPDKQPEQRLRVVRDAGALCIPFTSGILIGIGETRGERLDALLALRELHAEGGHLQELIIQNFRAKPGTPMSRAAEPPLADLQWTIALARLMFGPAMNIQCPPNLSPGALEPLLAAGINDLGGISPVTPDHVNPEYAWPQIDFLERELARIGRTLVERVASYPAYVAEVHAWHDRKIAQRVLDLTDANGFARESEWVVGAATPPALKQPRGGRQAWRGATALSRLLRRVEVGNDLDEDEVVQLLSSRGGEVDEVTRFADELRRETSGDVVRYVVNRNINYTNVCMYACSFCAFSKRRRQAEATEEPYDLPLEEIARRTKEAWERGATEVCMQGGISPRYDGNTYLRILAVVKEAVPGIHVHAFSPLEVLHGAESLGLTVESYLGRLRDAGLGSLPGTAAEILADEVRQRICPDKVTTAEWVEVMRTAHRLGLRSTATIMFGHVEAPIHQARHLLTIRAIQASTRGFTEFVPLPFVHMEAPIYRKGGARRGPTWRETVLMHAVARIVLHPILPNIQASWVKLGEEGLLELLRCGVNDAGGTLMNESISRAAGAQHGQELGPARMEALIARAGRLPRQRTTLYGVPPQAQVTRSFAAGELAPVKLVRAVPRRSVAPVH